MAASIALRGQATVQVERAGSDTVAARIVQILEAGAAAERGAPRWPVAGVDSTF